MADDETPRPPHSLESLVQWQVSKVATVGARLTSSRMPLGGRADFAVLAALEQDGPLSQAGLGRRLGLDRNDVNEIVGRLEAADHIVRAPDPADRRRNSITITRAGTRRAQELEEIALTVQDDLLHGLDDTEREQLRRLLAQVLGSHGPQAS